MTRPTSDLATEIAPQSQDHGSRRIRLREFQAQLVERMQAVSSGAQTQASQLGVMIGQSRWLLNLQEAGEIASVGAITPVPLTQDWYLGLTNIRGNLISVIDLARFRGMPLTPVDKESRIVAFAPALGFNSGLLVSRVMGLRNVREMQLLPQVDSVTWASQRYADREDQVWTELNLSLIVQDPQFLHVGL
ncbi:MAG TPA: chemotaxis protein CheW [Noviherbaspirillum sp.]